jgi:predicted chitinase
MTRLSINELKEIMPHARADDILKYVEPLNDSMERFFINTPLRQAAFIAQIAHESGSLHYSEEIWGPTEAQLKYSHGYKAKELGNDEPEALRLAKLMNGSVGYVYRGRGILQTTGYYNYRKLGNMFGWQLEKRPIIAAEPWRGSLLAGAFWFINGLNALADSNDFMKITRIINGGTSGLTNRIEFYNKARQVLNHA